MLSSLALPATLRWLRAAESDYRNWNPNKLAGNHRQTVRGTMIFPILIFVVAIAAGAVAAVSGFGIGSPLTPVFVGRYGTKLAVAMVSVPHLLATAARFLRLRQHLDRRVFLNFGILSAVGGLAGALLNASANSSALAVVFGCLLVFAGMSGLTGFIDRMHFGPRIAWLAGGLSGFFGGLVGNQG